MRPRVLVLPWLKPVGNRLLGGWLAITIGPVIIAWRSLSQVELAHETEHYYQWLDHGAFFPILYFAASLEAWTLGDHWYWGNKFEITARQAAMRGKP